MMHLKIAAGAVAVLFGTAKPCDGCGPQTVAAQSAISTGKVVQDTATVRLHISKMTCGSCPVTARIALERVSGVLTAKVTLADSLGVVRYDPSKVTPTTIAIELTRRTGYPARIIPDSTVKSKKP